MAIKDEVFVPDVGLTFRNGRTTFRVWAPFAASVGLLGDFNNWQEAALENGGNGHWHIELLGVKAGETYKYVIHTQDGQTLYRNDPRSLQVTLSTEGVSVIPDMDFDWEDDQYTPPPKEQMVIYEMHVGTFDRIDKATVGSFNDVIKKLDYLEELGITTIELMPINSMMHSFGASSGWGYDPDNLYAVESNYGGRRGFMELVKACHKRGIGVILDVVYNHFVGDDLWRFDGWKEDDWGGIYVYNDERAETPWGYRPDYGRQEVRQYILDNIKMWLVDYHVDGFRLDSTIFMRNKKGNNDDPDNDLGEAWTLLGSINELAHKINPNVLTIAEDWGANEWLTKPVSEGGCGFDTQWDLSLPRNLRKALNAEPGALSEVCYSLFLSFNGDTMQKVVFADSHDTAANGSDRVAEEARPNKENAVAAQKISVLASAVALTAPGIPMILQGQEFMQGGSFSAYKELDWEKAERFAGIIQASRDLINLRLNKHGHSLGLSGRYIDIFHRNDTNCVIGYKRTNDEGNDVLVIINFSNSYIPDYHITLPSNGDWNVRFNSSWTGYSQDFKETILTSLQPDEYGNVTLDLRGYMVVILSR